ncbi:MAG: FAD-dependent monooxygenase, partial [Vulcanimicrobiaceae bacterium]
MDAPVVIAGGGPVGLSLSLALARYGVRSIVVEPLEQPVQESRALVVWTRTLEIFRDWGIYDAMVDAGTLGTRLEPREAATNAMLLTVDFTFLSDVVDRPGYLLIPQNVTEAVMRRLVREHPSCELRTGVSVTGVSQDDAGVRVTVRDSAGNESGLAAAFAVGCDGAHGAVRHAIGLTLEGATYPMHVVLSDEILASDGPDFDSPRVALGGPSLLAAIKYADRSWRILAPQSGDDPAALGDEARAARVRALFGDGVRSTTVWQSRFQIHRRHVQRFGAGRVLLAGDAAHLNSPAGGQGMNSGIQDAANLAWKLAYALEPGHDVARLLDSYDVERREMVTDSVERMTNNLTQFAFRTSSRFKSRVIAIYSRFLRSRGMQRKASRAMGMLGGRYTKSPLVDARHPLAGRRIDDVVLDDGTRLNRKRAGNAALVVLGAASIGRPPSEAIVIAVTAPPKRWQVKMPAAIVVRPDGCVAAVVERPTPESL